MFLVRILAMRKVYWILEQSLNSFPWHMPVLRQDQENGTVGGLAWQRRFVWMGQFGHELWKRTELVGVFQRLDLSFPTQLPPKRNVFSAYSTWRNKQGVRRCFGKPGLKATEHYPPRILQVQCERQRRGFAASVFFCSGVERGHVGVNMLGPPRGYYLQKSGLRIILQSRGTRVARHGAVNMVRRGCTLIQAVSASRHDQHMAIVETIERYQIILCHDFARGLREVGV